MPVDLRSRQRHTPTQPHAPAALGLRSRRGAQSPSLRVGLQLVLATLLLHLVGCGDGPRPQAIVLVTLDTTRRDHVAPYPGAPAAATPAFERLASEGRLITTMQSVAPLTAPAHASMLTGLLPPSHGVRINFADRLPAEVETVAEALRDAGYATAAFVSAPVLASRWGLAQGFGHFDAPEIEERPGADTAALASAWLESIDSPLFLWLHLFDAHTPYRPPPPFDARFDDPYQGEIAAADAALDTLVRALDRRVGARSTLLVVVGDHGEGLDDHRELEHGLFVYEEMLQVPALVRWPGRIEPGSIDASPRSVVDVAPTLLAAVGLDLDAGSAAASLLEPTPASRPLYGESRFGERTMGWAPLTSLRIDDWKLIDAPRIELYDLTVDASEMRNVAASELARASALTLELQELVASLPTAPAAAGGGALDPQAMQALLGLGYVTAGAGQAGDEAPVDPKDGIEAHRHFELGKRHLFAEEWQAARTEFSQLLETFPDHLPALFDLASAEDHAGQLDEAADTYRRILAVDPANALAWFNLGGILTRAGDLAGAVEAYEEGAKEPYFAARAGWMAAATLAKLGRNESASQRFASARQVGPSPVPWMEEFARLNDELVDAQRAASARPADAAPTLRVAVLQLRMQLPEAATHTLDGAIARGLEPATSLLLRGQARLATEDRRAAQRDFRAALEHDPKHLNAALYLAMTLAEDGDLDGAERVLARALETHPENASVHYNLACIRGRAGRAEQAFADLRAAVAAGYARFDYLLEDPDLAPVRAHPGFADWLAGARQR